MSYKNKIPLNVQVGDKVKTKDLLKNKLTNKSVLMDEIKTWQVEEVKTSFITVPNGRKAPVSKRKTIVVLIAKRNKKSVRSRVWWLD